MFVMPEALYESAQSFAVSAMERQAMDAPRAALYAGTSLEHLFKAVLVQRNPVLILDLKDWRAVAEVLGHPIRPAKPGQSKAVRRRTISCRDAAMRVKNFLDMSSVVPDDLDDLIDLRDGTVHLALGGSMETALLLAFVEAVSVCLADLGKEPAEFWAEHLRVVNLVQEKGHSERALQVQQKLAAAKGRFALLTRELKLALRLLAPVFDWRQNEAPMECMACGSAAIATGRYHANRSSGYDDREGWVVDVDPIFHAYTLSCRICGLEITEQDMSYASVAALDVNWDVDFDEVDPEPDEDPLAEDIAMGK